MRDEISFTAKALANLRIYCGCQRNRLSKTSDDAAEFLEHVKDSRSRIILRLAERFVEIGEISDDDARFDACDALEWDVIDMQDPVGRGRAAEWAASLSAHEVLDMCIFFEIE